jgi:hypothetical protein
MPIPIGVHGGPPVIPVVNPTGRFFDPYQILSGVIIASGSSGVTTARAVPVLLPTSQTCIAIGIPASSPTTQTCRAALYDIRATDGLLGNVLAETANVTLVNGMNSLAFSAGSLALDAGYYWIAATFSASVNLFSIDTMYNLPFGIGASIGTSAKRGAPSFAQAPTSSYANTPTITSYHNIFPRFGLGV